MRCRIISGVFERPLNAFSTFSLDESTPHLNLTLLFAVILEKTIRIPRSLSVKAASILKGFLNKNPADRLGCHKETGFMEIMSHPFFKTIEWELVSEKYLQH